MKIRVYVYFPSGSSQLPGYMYWDGVEVEEYPDWVRLTKAGGATITIRPNHYPVVVERYPEPA